VTTAFDVVVIGAGAAGLMAAIRAGQRGRRVLLPVRDRPGGGRHRPARRPQFPMGLVERPGGGGSRLSRITG
jgi:phytoene dehydrogenase-like protein